MDLIAGLVHRLWPWGFVYVVGWLLTWYAVYFFDSQSANDTGTIGVVALAWPIGIPIGILYLLWALIKISATVLVAGIDNLMSRMLQTVIDENPMGRLLRVPRPHGRMRTYLEVADHSGTHRIPVDPECETVAQALAWSFDLKSEDEYAPVVEV